MRQHHKGATQLVNKSPCLWLQARPRQALVSPRAKESYTAACTSVFGSLSHKNHKGLALVGRQKAQLVLVLFWCCCL